MKVNVAVVLSVRYYDENDNKAKLWCERIYFNDELQSIECFDSNGLVIKTIKFENVLSVNISGPED